MLAIFSLVPTLLGVLGELPKVIAVIEAIGKAIMDAESTTLKGQDKMTAVLNDAEAAINAIAPGLATPFATFAGAIESAVNEAVAILNLFKNAAPHP